MNRTTLNAAGWLVVTVLAACSRTEAPVTPAARVPAAASAAAASQPTAADGGIAWTYAANDAEVDAAFARARSESKPVFVYWGATWCPPCNQLKATLFTRQDFIERSRAFVPVYVDGDRPGAQKLGARFAVRGYPTTVLFSAAGQELTRLPGEVDAQQYNELLTLGMAARRPVKAVLAQARAGGQGLDAAEWRLLAFYSWETDQQQLADAAGIAPLLRELAQACPPDQADAAMRLRLKALAAADAKVVPASDAAAQRPAVLALLADAALARRQMDVLTNNAPELVRALSAAKSLERSALRSAYDGALQRLQADATLSRTDRMSALIARVQLARLDEAKGTKPTQVVVPEALRAEVRELSARLGREVKDAYERETVVNAAAYALEQAGLLDDSDALLKANLATSRTPFYAMADLASNAKARGDSAGALDWYAKAFERSEGPATRLQWGASYLGALVELAPQDAPRIERLARQLIDEAAAQPDGFEARSGRSMQRVGARLLAWNAKGAHRVALQHLQQQLDGVCARLVAGTPARAQCDGMLRAGPPVRAA
jgi:thioredoxin-like negative regulator of GroEL